MNNLSTAAIATRQNDIECEHPRSSARREACLQIQAASKAAAKAIAALAGQAANATAQRQLSAIQLCLTSVTGLLEITETLLVDKSEPTPYEKALGWQRLSEDAKGAGRAAYRAVLILADPNGDHSGDVGQSGRHFN